MPCGSHADQVRSTVKTVMEFCQITRIKFFVNRMIRIFQRILHIPKDRVYPFEGRMSDGMLATTDDIRMMARSLIDNSFKTGAPIGLAPEKKCHF